MLSILFLSLIPSLTNSEIVIPLQIRGGRNESQRFRACEFINVAQDGSFYLRCEKTVESSHQESVIPEAEAPFPNPNMAKDGRARGSEIARQYQAGSANKRYGFEGGAVPAENPVGLNQSGHLSERRRSESVSSRDALRVFPGQQPRASMPARGRTLFVNSSANQQRRSHAPMRSISSSS